MNETGKMMKEFRKRNMLSIRDCAPIFGVSHSRIWQIEHSERKTQDMTKWRIEKTIAEYEKGREK